MKLLFILVALWMSGDVLAQDDARSACVASCYQQAGKPVPPKSQPDCIVDVRSISTDCDEILTKNKIDIAQTDTGRYFYSLEKKNWHDASRWCRTNGMQLAGLETPMENSQAVEKIASNMTLGETFWVGACDHVADNQWYWSETGEDIVDYKNWDTDEPNIANKKTVLRCVFVRGAAGKWVVEDCMVEKRFICEVPELCFKQYCTNT